MFRLARVLIIIVILAFLVTGVALTMQGFSFENFKFFNLSFGSNQDYDELEDVDFENTYSIRDFNDMEIDITSANCEFITEDRSDVKVVYKGKGKFSAEINFSSLDIVETFKGFHVSSIRSGSLIVFIPTDFHKDLKINSVSGDVEFDNIKSDKLSIETISGKISVKNVVSSTVYTGTISGSIDLEDFSFTDMSLKTISGRCTIEAIGDWENIKATSVSGDYTIKVDSDSDPNISFSSVSGDIESDIGVKKDKGSNQSISVKTTSGDLNINVIR